MASRSDAGRVLVTGCTGFTGRYVAAALDEAGYAVIDAEAAGSPFDLTQPASIAAVLQAARPDYVIHLAALSFVGLKDATAFYAVNTVGTAQAPGVPGHGWSRPASGRDRQQRERLRQCHGRTHHRGDSAGTGQPLRRQQAGNGMDGADLC